MSRISRLLNIWLSYADPLHWHSIHDLASKHHAGVEEPASQVRGVIEVAHGDVSLGPENPALDSVNDSLIPALPIWRPTRSTLQHHLTPTLKLVRAWTIPKEAARPEANEDSAIWIPARQLAAVFDGATESFAARRWVRIVGRAWRAGDFDLQRVQGAYASELDGTAFSWAQAEAVSRGSFTTLVSVSPAEGGLQATVIGDSALLLLKDFEIVDAFPSMSPAYYTSAPEALSSAPASLAHGQQLLTDCSWTLPLQPETVDSVLLVTDALATWLLSELPEARGLRVERLLACRSQASFDALVTEERSHHKLKVDDSTIVHLKLGWPE